MTSALLRNTEDLSRQRSDSLFAPFSQFTDRWQLGLLAPCRVLCGRAGWEESELVAEAPEGGAGTARCRAPSPSCAPAVMQVTRGQVFQATAPLCCEERKPQLRKLTARFEDSVAVSLPW